MMMKLTSIAVAALICLLGSSCATLKSRHFPGTQEMITENQLSAESVWKYGEGIYHVKVVSSNEVVASSVKWCEETCSHKVESLDVIASKLEDTLFLNVKSEELYTILRVVPAGKSSIVLLTVNREKIGADLDKGVIKGTKDGGSFILECSKRELDDYIRANLDSLFSLEAAGVLELIEGEMN
jgi:hypothetical protein